MDEHAPQAKRLHPSVRVFRRAFDGILARAPYI
jgi:hypothetical protein